MSARQGRTPDYQCWWEGDFHSDFTVMQMNWIQKLLYRCLLQQAFVCNTAPYVPDDDNILWILAGAESLEQWQHEKTLILSKFERFDEGGRGLLRNKRLEEDWGQLEAARQKHDKEYEAKAPLRKEQAGKAAEARWGAQRKKNPRAPADGAPCSGDAAACSAMPKSQTESQSESKTKRENLTTGQAAGRPALSAGSDSPETETEDLAQAQDSGTLPQPQTPEPLKGQELPAAAPQPGDAKRLAQFLWDEFFRSAESEKAIPDIRRMERSAAAILRSRSVEEAKALIEFAKNEPWWSDRITAADYPMAFFAKSIDTLAEQYATAKRNARAETAPAPARRKAQKGRDMSPAVAWLDDRQKAGSGEFSEGQNAGR